MFEIVKLLFNICLFRKGPQDLPHSPRLFWIVVLIYAGISFLMLNIDLHWTFALLQTLASILLAVVFSWTMLYLGRKSARFYQTACSLLGADALISFFTLPATATIVTGRLAWLALVVMVVSMVWYWAVAGHIIRNALEKTMGFSLGLAFLYILVSYQVMAVLFPEVAGLK